jgi:DNA polymerase III subunit delta
VVGEDEAEKASLAAAFVEAVEPDFRAFNVERLYGGETRAATVLDAVRTLPMLAPRRIVVVLQAERLLVPKRESEAAERDLESLSAYIKAPLPEATLVLVADALDKRRSIAKLLYQQATIVECGSVTYADEAEAWVCGQVMKAGMTIDGAAARLLVERAGFVAEPTEGYRRREEQHGDIGRLRADTERACLYALEQKKVSVADVREVVGPETAQDAWDFIRELERGSVGGALRELGLLLESGGVPFMILGQLRSFVEKATNVPSARLPGAIEALFRTDLALKSSAGDPRILLERLVVELCERKAPRA